MPVLGSSRCPRTHVEERRARVGAQRRLVRQQHDAPDVDGDDVAVGEAADEGRVEVVGGRVNAVELERKPEGSCELRGEWRGGGGGGMHAKEGKMRAR